MADVANQISDKLIHRHPHIYGETDVEDADQVVKNWEDIKLKEGKKSVLEGVPKSLPALVKAYRIQDKVSGVGFDWDQKEAVLEKVKEELDELRTEIDTGDSKNGGRTWRWMFSLVNYARFLVDPKMRWNAPTKNSSNVLTTLRKKPKKSQRKVSELSIEEMEILWQEAKKQTDLGLCFSLFSFTFNGLLFN